MTSAGATQGEALWFGDGLPRMRRQSRPPAQGACGPEGSHQGHTATRWAEAARRRACSPLRGSLRRAVVLAPPCGQDLHIPQTQMGVTHVREAPMLTETINSATDGQPMGLRKNIALIAHDNRKQDLVEWARFNRDLLAAHRSERHRDDRLPPGRGVGPRYHPGPQRPPGRRSTGGRPHRRRSAGPPHLLLGPLEPHPHDVDVKALLRIAVVYNIPVACNRASADFIISSPLLGAPYVRQMADHERPRLFEEAEEIGPGANSEQGRSTRPPPDRPGICPGPGGVSPGPGRLASGKAQELGQGGLPSPTETGGPGLLPLVRRRWGRGMTAFSRGG